MSAGTEVRERTVFAAASVGAIALAVLLAIAIGTSPHRVWLAVSGLIGVAMTFPSLFTDPRDLVPALVFSVPPIMALSGNPETAWLVAPLAVLLLVGAELNAACWAADGARAGRDFMRRRAGRIGRLAVLALIASLAVVFAARLTWLESIGAVVVAAVALAALAGVVFPARR